MAHFAQLCIVKATIVSHREINFAISPNRIHVLYARSHFFSRHRFVQAPMATVTVILQKAAINVSVRTYVHVYTHTHTHDRRRNLLDISRAQPPRRQNFSGRQKSEATDSYGNTLASCSNNRPIRCIDVRLRRSKSKDYA